jgi:hypothetical protein
MMAMVPAVYRQTGRCGAALPVVRQYSESEHQWLQHFRGSADGAILRYVCPYRRPRTPEPQPLRWPAHLRCPARGLRVRGAVHRRRAHGLPEDDHPEPEGHEAVRKSASRKPSIFLVDHSLFKNIANPTTWLLLALETRSWRAAGTIVGTLQKFRQRFRTTAACALRGGPSMSITSGTSRDRVIRCVDEEARTASLGLCRSWRTTTTLRNTDLTPAGAKAFDAATRTEIEKLGEGVLVRTRAVDRGYRDAKLAQVHRQLAAVVIPVVEHDRSQHRNPRHR